MIFSQWRRLAAAISLSLFVVHPCLADAIDEIVVTADFRERSVRDIPSSVVVLNAEFIRDNSTQHFEELINGIANLNWSGDGHRARYFQIRGVGELEQYQGAPNPSIGFLIDDIDFSGIATVATTFDMESVEVLRGPQGIRYGANALGGLIYMRSKAPSAERDGSLQMSLGGDDLRSLALAFGGALDGEQSTTFRFSAEKYESNGFRDNAFLDRDDTNGRDETTLRVRLRSHLSDILTANVAVLYADIDNGYDAFALDNSLTVLSNRPGKDAQESIGASLRLDWSLQHDRQITAITAVADSDITFSFDADWGNTESWNPFTYDYLSSSDRDRNTISQEIRYQTNDWLLGLYALRLKDRISTTDIGEYYDPFFDFADSLNAIFDSDYESTNVALFVQRDLRLNDNTVLSAGLRGERRSTRYVDSNGLTAGPDDSMWGGAVSLRREHSPDLSSYISLSRGYKAGGFNLGPTPDGKRDYGVENMTSIEVGIKGGLLDDRVSFSAAVFNSWRDDQQVRTSVQLDPNNPASFVFFTDNIAKGQTRGIELDLRWFASDAIEVYSSVGLLRARLDAGRELAHAPSYSIAAGIVYKSEGGLFARLDATAKDAFYFDVNHDQRSQRYALLNGRVGFESDDWRLSLWGRNLLDKDYAVRGFFFGNEPPNFPNTLYTRSGDARQVGITIERRFY